MSAAESRPATLARRRRSQVFVEIPYSSITARLASSPLSSTISRKRSASHLKENAPLSERKSQTTMTTDMSTPSKKRKSAEEDDELTDSSTAKKAKLATPAPQTASKVAMKSKSHDDKEIESNEQVDEFPNGYFYCHQCCRKRDPSAGIQCTWKRIKPRSKNELERCPATYCRPCLKNRYREDMDAILSRGTTSLSPNVVERHVLVDGYYYQCPKCQDNCNCRNCRKAKGLEPTGNFNLAARRAERAAAEKAKMEAEALKQAKKAKRRKTSKVKRANNVAGSSKPAKSASSAKPTKSATSAKSSTPATPTVAAKPAKPRAKAKPKAPPVKPMPKPVWTRVATDLNLTDAESRIHIREFVVRFASVLQIPHSHIEELDEISGDNLGEILEWDDHHADDVEIISWVSELCAKEIIRGLLDILASHAEARGDEVDAEALQEAVKAVKASGANLNRTWAALLALRSSLSKNSVIHFSDPLPPPASTLIRTTRQNKDSDVVHIAVSAQLIPTISDLINYAVASSAIRDALDAGLTEEKDYGKLAREAIAAENTRWKESKEAKEAPNAKKGEAKEARDQHHRTVEDLESAHRLLSCRYISRMLPLGRDADGRIYYAMTPGVGETDAAVSLLKGKDARVKVGRKKGGFSEEDRKEMERWAWFVAVWGRKPEGALEEKRNTEQDDDESEQESDEECWWGFWQPQEIQKMAEWLSMKSSLDDDATTAKNSNGSKTNGAKASALVKGKGSRSRTSTATSSLSSLSTHATPFSSFSDISDLSDDEENSVSFERPLGYKRELQELVSGLKHYADLLQWRIKRASQEAPVKSSKDDTKTQTVPTNRFYS